MQEDLNEEVEATEEVVEEEATVDAPVEAEPEPEVAECIRVEKVGEGTETEVRLILDGPMLALASFHDNKANKWTLTVRGEKQCEAFLSELGKVSV